jgi:hypothetical protein
MLPPPPDLPLTAVTATFTDCAAEPPGPVQVSVNVLVASRTMEVVPVVASDPFHEGAPLAVHAVVLAELQVSWTVPPELIDVAFAVRVTVGTDEATLIENSP